MIDHTIAHIVVKYVHSLNYKDRVSCVIFYRLHDGVFTVLVTIILKFGNGEIFWIFVGQRVVKFIKRQRENSVLYRVLLNFSLVLVPLVVVFIVFPSSDALTVIDDIHVTQLITFYTDIT